jgi:predicted DNA-binding antitoxin AbrB/MazE fold protein
MTTKLRAQFDGKTLVPLEPVDLPVGQILDIEVSEAGGLPPGSPELVLRIMDSLPKLAPEDIAELERAIEDGQRPATYDSIFDEQK